MSECITWDRDKFKEFLRNKNLSPRVISDNLSRCRRIEKELSINLIQSTDTLDKCMNVMEQINVYSEKNSKAHQQRYTMGCTLRLSFRLFVEYQWGIIVPKNALYQKYKDKKSINTVITYDVNASTIKF